MADTLAKTKVKNSDARVVKKGKKGNEDTLDLSLVAVIDNMAFSKTNMWAYYRLENSPYDFLSDEGKYIAHKRISNAFNNLMAERQDPLECRLIVTSVPIDINAWREQVYSNLNWERPIEFDEFIEEQEEHLRAQDFQEKVVYLAVHIGRRGALDFDTMGIIESGFRGAIDSLKEWSNVFLGLSDGEVSATEEKHARSREGDLYTKVADGHLQAKRCNSEEILLLLKRELYPAMPAPYLDVDHENRLGPGDIALEYSSVIHNKFRWLKITQIVDEIEMTGYRATMTFTKFPKLTQYPEMMPFLFFMDKIGLPFTQFACFTMYPSSAMKKEVDNKAKVSKDELSNIASSQDAIDSEVDGLPADVENAMGDMKMISQTISEDKSPWIRGTYHIVVETKNEKQLKKYCAQLKQHYTDMDMNLTWSAGDQAKLFLQQMPADKIRVTDFEHITNLNIISAAGPTFSSEVGDRIPNTALGKF